MPQFDMDPAAASSDTAHISVFGADMIGALPTQDMTVEMWTRFVAGGSDWAGPISASQDDGSTEFGWNIQTRCADPSGSGTACSLSRRIEFSLKSEGGPMGYLGYPSGGRCTYATGGPIFADLAGEWHHLAVTYDGTETAMYADGNMVMSDVTTNSGPIQYPSPTYEANQGGWFTIGAYHDANEYYSFPGAIDELRVWHVKVAPDMGCAVDFSAAPDLNYYYQFDGSPEVGTGPLPGGTPIYATLGPDAVTQGDVGRVCGNCGTCTSPVAPPPPPPQPCWNGVSLVDNGDLTEGDGQYDNGMLCTWALSCSNPAFVPQITFTAFNTEAGWDYVNIFDGIDASGNGLAQYHGDLSTSGLPEPLNGNTDSVFVQFTSDGSVIREGFTAAFACVDPLDMPADCSTEDLVLDWVGGMHASGHAAFDGASQEHVSLTTNSLMVVVANPLDGCMGGADGQAAATLTGNFADGSMTGKIALIQRGTCFFTTKTMNAQNAGAIAVVIYNNAPGLVVMGGPDIGITVPAIFVDQAVGDALNAAVTTDPTMQVSMHCGAQSFHMPNPCVEGRTYTDGGDVSMVGGYNNGHDCNWLLTCSDPTLSPRVIFASFNTEAGWDFVNFYDGETTGATRIAQLHGNSIPDPVVGSGPVALVQFTSDGSVTRDGFVGTFDCTASGTPPPPDPCVGGITITDGGAIDFIRNDYENGMQCQWTHVCNSGIPAVSFDTFQTEGNWDFVNIYDGASAADVRVGRYSGTVADGISGSGSTLLIEFTSDGSVVQDGFSATLTCVGAIDPCVDDLVLSGDTSFALDGGYDNGHDCNFVLTCPSGTPTVSFSSFETEANWDFVYIYDGDTADAPELGVCHGTSCPGRFVGTTEAALVRFTSDGSVTRQGFSASYTCTPQLDACGESGSNNEALPGAGAVITDGMAITYDQGTTDYTNCVWTTACPEGTVATVDFTGVSTEGGWDFLNVHSDAANVANCIGPAGSNGGCDNSGDLGQFSGSVADFSMTGVAAIQYISDWSVQSSPAGFTALLNCAGPEPQQCSVEDLVLDWVGGFHASGHAAFDGAATVQGSVDSQTMVVADPLDGCMDGADGQAATTLTGNFADGSMTGKIALIRRGVCFFTTKVMNAQNAGAIAAVIYNDDRPGLVVMGGPAIGVTIPSIFIEGAQGDALNAAVTADPDTIVSMHCGTDSLHMPPADQIACSVGLTLNNAEGGSFSKTGGYDNGHDCNWNLVCPDSFAPIVTFTAFQTEAGWDFVSIYDGADASAPQLANCNGASCPDQTASQSNMLVRFTSDGSVTMDGFEATYVCGNPAGADENACGPLGSDNQASPGLYNMADGETVTYEQGATDYTNCVWTPACADGQVASVEFSNVVSEGGWDFLNVASSPDGLSNCIGPAGSNGGCDNTGDLGRFSGATPQGMTIEGVGAFQFITDWSVQEAGAGFTATLTCVMPPNPCAVPVSPVPVTADFGNAGGYTNNQDCYWTGSCAAGRPTVTFNTFQTEGNWDFVNVYPGAATSGATLARCHGSSCQLVQGEPGGSLTVHFESDGSVVQDGFSATFSCDMTVPYNPYDCTYTKYDNALSMQDAETACTVLGGHLAAIHNPTQQAAIGALSADGAWIGFHDRHSEAGCTGQSNGVGEAGGFIWTDGSPTDFLAWGAGEPNDWEGGLANCDTTSTVGEDCTHVRADNLWNDAACDGARAYVCQNCGVIPGPTSFTKIDNAGDMWTAEALCHDQGGHLASVHSDADKDAIAALGPNGAWIGFHDTYAEAGCTGQANDVGETGGFVWTDGTATDYLSWGGGEPNDWEGGIANCDTTSTVGEDCSHVRDDNNWNDAGCTDNRAAICGFNGDWIPNACNGGATLWGGGTFQKNAGYDDGHDCNWLLMCDDGLAPSVTFSAFQLEANWDFVRMYEGFDTSSAPVATCTGASCDGASSSTSSMLVRMTSDGSVTQDGFVASYTCGIPGAPPMTACGAANNGAAANEALPGNGGAGQTVACGEVFGLTSEPDHMTNCVWVMEQTGTVSFASFTSEGNWDFLNVWSDASAVVNIWGPAGSNGGVDNTGDLGRFSGTDAPGTIAGVAAVQFITDWSYMEPGTGFQATLTC